MLSYSTAPYTSQRNLGTGKIAPWKISLSLTLTLTQEEICSETIFRGAILLQENFPVTRNLHSHHPFEFPI